MTALPPALASLLGSRRWGCSTRRPERAVRLLLHADANDGEATLPTNTLLRPFLDAQLPDGVGMMFDEQMKGWYFPGARTPAPGRAGDLTIAALHSGDGRPADACRLCSSTGE